MPQELPDEWSAKLDQLIACAESKIEQALQELRVGVASMFRFANMEDIDAACLLLEERGEPMPLDEIVLELKRGGRWHPPSNSRGGPDSDMKRSISMFASRNRGAGDRVRYFGPPEEDVIGLVGWRDEQFRCPVSQ